MARSQGAGLLTNVQIARGLAALMVALAHANLIVDKNLFGGFLVIGWSGVDFFFVLSGFIIFHKNRWLFGKPAALPSYLRKRFLRVYPIYWVYTLGLLALHFAMLAAFGKTFYGWTDLGFEKVIKDLLLWPTGAIPVIPVAWTLTYEMVFYLLFGLAIAFGGRPALFMACCWLSFILLTAIGWLGPHDPASILYVLGYSKCAEFLMGCSAAYVVQRRLISPKQAVLMFFCGLGFLSFVWMNAHLDFRWWARSDALQFGAAYTLIVLSIAELDVNNKTAPKWIRRAGVLLGDASYSLYLTHYFALVVLASFMIRFDPPSGWTFAIVTPLTIAFGLLSYLMVEKPLLKWLTTYRNRGLQALRDNP